MLTSDFEAFAKRFLKRCNESGIATKLQSLAGVYEKFLTASRSTAKRFGDTQESHNATQRLLGTVMSGIETFRKQTKTSEFFDELKHLDEMIEALTSNSEIRLQELRNAVSRVHDLYDEYLQASDSSDIAIQVVTSAAHLASLMKQTQDLLKEVVQSLALPLPEETPELKSLTLRFDDDFPLDILAHKLLALQTAYKGICSVLNPESDEDLQIVRVEYGSFLITVLGYVLPIKLLEKVLLNVAKIAYRRNLIEGKIDAQAELLNHLKANLELRNELKEAGFSTDSIDIKLATIAEQHFDASMALMATAFNMQVNGKPAIDLYESLALPRIARHVNVESKTNGLPAPPDGEQLKGLPAPSRNDSE